LSLAKGVSRLARVRQIELRALKKLRHFGMSELTRH
jgi:DNA-directed RNA polymerase sigma subunit (sigma70/sigma32)